MRPAQLTPENGGRLHLSDRERSRFNEAGAINAGKQELLCSLTRCRKCFNEAGAINAGKLVDPMKERHKDNPFQ